MIVAPVAVLGGAWWLVNEVLLVPGRPTAASSASACIEYCAHEKGLARLEWRAGYALVLAQVERIAREPEFREEFASALRRLPGEQQAAFKEHVFGVLKPAILECARTLESLEGAARDEYLDERLIEYKRLELLMRSAKSDRSLVGGAMLDAQGLLDVATGKSSVEEQQLALTYLRALTGRYADVQADPQRKAAFLARLGIGG